MVNEEKIISERKEKISNFFKSNPLAIFIGVVILLIILGAYIRYLPLSDHNGTPGLWDITTNDYTLGPDLDPFLFLRYAATTIQTGSLPTMDYMRNVPVGFDTTKELQMVPNFIVLTYKLINMFGTYSINYAGAFMPVLAFILIIVAFFLFVFEIFRRKIEDKAENKRNAIKSGLIASISTLFMMIIPAFLSRTVAGIPEKESIGFFFMFLTFYLFLKAWKSEKSSSSWVWAIFAGLSTALMGLSWGGVMYLYITIALTSLILFILNKFNFQKIVVYGLWFISAGVVTFMFTNRNSIRSFVLGIDSGLAFLVLGILIIHLILWNTKLKTILGLEKIKIPTTIISIATVLILGVVFTLILSPSFISNTLSLIYHTLITPVTGRWNTTVAENAQPYFTQWVGSFGKTIFWLFFIGSVVLFSKMFSKLRNKDKWILTGLYVLFFLGLVFSRYAPHPSLFDGENFISKFFYFGSALLLVCTIVYLYIKYHKENEFSFEKTETEYILLFVLFVLTLFTARGAVRLIMVLVPIAPIFLSYLIVELGYGIKEAKQGMKFIVILFFIIVLALSAYNAYGYYSQIKQESYNYTPYYYTYQWQEAMAWVRANTATNAVFAHWWDYGYWVQSIGNRATVTDGGNAIVWWNYLTGRLVLTGDNQKDSLEFLWNHNATHLLIDSSDIGKYGAFSQIGSDANFDRLSQGPITITSNAANTQETKDETIRTYFTSSGTGISLYAMEEDISYTNSSGSKINLFKENSGFAGIRLRYSQTGTGYSFKQAEAIFANSNSQISVPLRYLYVQNQMVDFKTGINAAASIIQKVDSNDGKTLNIDQIGAAMYLSPRVLRGFLGQAYVLNDSLNNFPNFKVVHSQPDYLLEQLNKQGANLGEFVYYYGLRGPIKIWSIKYTGTEKPVEDYTRTTVPDYITWKF